MFPYFNQYGWPLASLTGHFFFLWPQQHFWFHLSCDQYCLYNVSNLIIMVSTDHSDLFGWTDIFRETQYKLVVVSGAGQISNIKYELIFEKCSVACIYDLWKFHPLIIYIKHSKSWLDHVWKCWGKSGLGGDVLAHAKCGDTGLLTFGTGVCFKSSHGIQGLSSTHQSCSILEMDTTVFL